MKSHKVFMMGMMQHSEESYQQTTNSMVFLTMTKEVFWLHHAKNNASAVNVFNVDSNDDEMYKQWGRQVFHNSNDKPWSITIHDLL